MSRTFFTDFAAHDNVDGCLNGIVRLCGGTLYSADIQRLTSLLDTAMPVTRYLGLSRHALLASKALCSVAPSNALNCGFVLRLHQSCTADSSGCSVGRQAHAHNKSSPTRANSNAHICLCQGWAVIDAIPHHCYHLATSLEVLHSHRAQSQLCQTEL